ncbi:tail fiber domain-containing protein [Sporolactobacillus sp. CQH2019]|uniref:tail fiber domain-containing protein n=1 Tax=Sporolactobacillus sp. CQH2019 TaxID=3023512 RepID=UPI002367FD76|nr:tail fiber domain-containing protein [Sporolactobacillus sp. CQH2019]MDD9149342.1 tail fiber domain-containing protein [Sporolactobacillus sp. CQH2019]
MAIVSSSEITITDLSDGIAFRSDPPANPSVGLSYLDSTTSPATLKTWNGTAWVNGTLALSNSDPSSYQAIGTAQSTANNAIQAASNAQNTANGKNHVYYQSAQPTTGTTNDLWYKVNSDGTTKLYVYNGSSWTNPTDEAVQQAQSTADSMNKNYYDTAQPTGTGIKVGDIWYKTLNNADGTTSYQPYRWNGSAWVDLLNNDAYNAQQTADTANSTATSVNNTVSSNQSNWTSAYSTVTANQAVWNLASNINANGTWNTSKLNGTISDSQIASSGTWNSATSLLNSWKSGTTEINGGMIATNTVYANSIAIGDFTNIVAGSDFEDPNANPWNMPTGYSIDTAQHHSGSHSLKIVPTSNIAQTNSKIHVNAGDSLYLDFWMITTSDYNGTSDNSKVRFYSATNGSLLYAVAFGPASTTWKEVTATLYFSNTDDIYVSLPNNATAGSIWLDDIVLRHMMTGNLIVDGAITASKIQSLNGLTVKNGSTNTFVVDGSGNVTVSGNIVGGNISGVNFTGNNLNLSGALNVTGSISAASSGVVINNNGIAISKGSLNLPNTTIDSNGNLTTTNANITGTINATGGTFTGTITATGGTSSNPGDDIIKIGQGTSVDPLIITSKSDTSVSVNATSTNIGLYKSGGANTSIMAGSFDLNNGSNSTQISANDVTVEDTKSYTDIMGGSISIWESDTTKDTVSISGDTLGLGANITLYSHSQGKNAINIDSGGNIYGSGIISSGSTVDVGSTKGVRFPNAPGSSGNGDYNKLSVDGSNTNGLSAKNNVNIDTYNGFSVCPSSPNNPVVSQWKPAFSVSARDGNVYVAHWLYTQSITGLNGGALGLFGGANVRNSSNSAWAAIAASAFNVESSVDLKQDITPMTTSGLDIVNNTDIYNFHYIGDVEEGKANLKYGVIIGPDYKTPSSLLNYENDAVDLYNWNGIITKGMQELYQKVVADEQTITTLINTNNDLVSKVSSLQAKIGG